GDRHLGRLLVTPALQLDRAARERARPDRQPDGEADQVGVLELDPRPLVAVVEERVDAHRLQLGGEPFGGLAELRVGRGERRGQRSPPRACRRSAKARSGTSRSRSRLTTCSSARLAPLTAPRMPRSEASARVCTPSPTGPAKPTGAPVARVTAPSSASATGSPPSEACTLVSDASWSPRTRTATVASPAVR